MSRVTKENAKKGLRVWYCFDDRPIDGSGYELGIITDIFDDHYLFNTPKIGVANMWADYSIPENETEIMLESVAVFTTETEAKKWLKERDNVLTI